MLPLADSTADTPGPDPSDARSRIIDAAALLLREEGAVGVTTRAVARAAGVPAPTIFRIFGDKDGLVDAVAEHVFAAHVATKADGVDDTGLVDADPVQDLRAAWRTHIDFGLANPDLYVLISTPGRRERSPASEAGVRVLSARIGRLTSAGLLAVPEARAVDLVHAAGTGAVFALLQQPPERRDVSLAEAMLESVLDAILTRTPAPPATSLVPLALAFGSAVPDLPDLTDAERALLTEWLARTVAAMRG